MLAARLWLNLVWPWLQLWLATKNGKMSQSTWITMKYHTATISIIMQVNKTQQKQEWICKAHSLSTKQFHICSICRNFLIWLFPEPYKEISAYWTNMNGFADTFCHIFVLPVTCASTIQKSIYSSLSSPPTGNKHTLAKSGMKPWLQLLKATWSHFRPEPSHRKPKPLQQLGSASIRLGLFGDRKSVV